MSGTNNRRSDMAASKMGDLLLKGYRMLDASCNNCFTVLMQDRSGNNVCVLCAEDGNQVDAQSKLEAPTEVAMKEEEPRATSSGAALSAGVDTIVQGLLEEMEAASELLKSHRGIIDYINLRERQQVLQHIEMCVRIINELKSLQR